MNIGKWHSKRKLIFVYFIIHNVIGRFKNTGIFYFKLISTFIFLIRISRLIVCMHGSAKLCIHKEYILMEGSVSQIFYLGTT